MMRACLVAAAILALAAPQNNASAAAAGLASTDPAVRAQTACSLRDLGDAAAPLIPRLAALLGDGSPVDPAVCAERTWRGRGAQGQTTPGEQAASTLVAIGRPAQPVLLRTLEAPAWIARRNSAWALGAMRTSEAVPALIAALKDTNAEVREQVAWALGAIGDRRAVDSLIGALGDTAPGVRRQAAWALGAIGDDRAVAALVKSLTDADAGVRKQAAWALGAIGG